MMKRLGVFLLLLGLAAPATQGQPALWKKQARQLVPLSDLVSNRVQVLEAAGDSLWIGPLLTAYLEPADRPRSDTPLYIADVPSLNEGDNVVFAIEADNASEPLVWAGLAFDTGGDVPGAGGFAVLTEADSFRTIPAQLDEPSDTTIQYGPSTLSAAAITQQADSAPQDLAFGPGNDTVWVAGVRSGIRWTSDWRNNEQPDWNRTVLPSDTAQSVDPASPTSVFVGPPEEERGNLNHVGFSVLVDETGTVWAGTAKGLNRSRPSEVTAEGDRAWRRFGVADTANSLPGEFVVDLAEQPRPGRRNPIWVTTWAGQQQQDGPLQRFGLAVTPDGGKTFRQTLIGERISDVAARDGRVYAAGERGLFVSDDRGKTWRSVRDFPVQNENRVLPPEVAAQAVAVTDAALWLGTSDGLLRLDRAQEPALLTGSPEWQLFRAEVPVNPEEPSEEVPDVSTYAYPNPFVPSRDQLVRIAYELQQARTVTVTIYDFAMNKVRTITEQKSDAGQQETTWDGTDDRGLRVPTGTYFYRVDLGDNMVQGKILLAN
jgi:hypothetical protein